MYLTKFFVVFAKNDVGADVRIAGTHAVVQGFDANRPALRVFDGMPKIDLRSQILLLEKRHHQDRPTPSRTVRLHHRRWRRGIINPSRVFWLSDRRDGWSVVNITRRKGAMRMFVQLNGEPHLMQVVATLRSSRRFAN